MKTTLAVCIFLLLRNYFSFSQPYTVGLNPNPRIIQDDFLGFNGTNTISPDQSWGELAGVNSTYWADNPFCQFNLGHIRYPGGTVGNYWDFRTGWFLKPNQIPSGMTLENNFDNDIPPFPFDDRLQFFKISSDIINSSPIFTANSLTSDFYYQATMLYRAKELGFPVKYFELGNEFYLENENYYLKFPSVKQYAIEANKWAGLIKFEPGLGNVKCAALSSFSYGPNDDGRRRLWNKCLLDELKEFENSGNLNIDALTFHQYIGSGQSTSSGPVTMTPAEVQSMLSQPFDNLVKLQNNEFSLVNEYFGNTKEIWMTEYNMSDRHGIDDVSTHSTWAHGLFVASMALGYLEESNVTKVTMHTSLGNGVWSAFFSDNNGLSNWNDFTPPPDCQNSTITGERSSSGSAMQLIAEAIKHSNTAQQLTFSGGTVPLINGTGTHEALYGWKFSSDFGEKIIILNLHSGALDLTGIGSNNFFTGNPSTVNWLTLHMNNLSNIDNVFNAPNANPVALASASNDCELYFEASSALNTSSALTLKPHSITLLSYDFPSQIIANATETTICDNTTTSIKVYGYENTPTALIIGGAGTVTDNGPACPDVFTFTPAVGQSTPSTIEITDGSSTAQVSITVNAAPSLTVAPTSGSSFCPSTVTPISFSASLSPSSPNDRFIWTPTNFIVGGNPALSTVDFLPDTTINVIVYATNGTCWVSNSDAPVTISSDKPEYDLDKDVSTCIGATNVKLEISNQSGNYNYIWSTGATDDNITAPPISAGLQTYTVTVTGANLCTKVDEVNILGVSCCTGGGSDAVMNPHFLYHYSNVDGGGNLGLTNVVGAICATCVTGTGTALNPYIITDDPSLGNIIINGRFRVTAHITFENCTIQLGEKAEIIVRPDRTLKFQACTIEQCGSELWKHIKADDETATIIINNPTLNDYTYISGAETALQLENLAQFGIWHGVFDNNLTHIRFKDYFGDITQNYNLTGTNPSNYIAGNTFSGTTFSPDISIDVQYASSLTIGTSGTTNRNTFSNSMNGITATNASIWLRNNHFYDIPRADVSAMADDECNDRFLEAGTGFSGGANLFETSGNGIIAIGEMNLKINKNAGANGGFNNISNESIVVYNNYTKKIEIIDNDITGFNIGVLGFDIGMNVTLDISSNHFSAPNIISGQSYSGAAITIQNPVHYKSDAPKNITFNIIDDARIGIHYMNLDGINVADNEINFNLASIPADPYTGIWSMRNAGSNIMRNAITQSNTNTGWGNMLTGIEMNTSMNTYLGCNDITNTGWSMHLVNDCGAAQLHNNYMHNYDIAVQCDNATVPPQGSPGISWENIWLCDDATANQFNMRVDGTVVQPINWFHFGSSVYTNAQSPTPGNPLAVFPIGGATAILVDPCGIGDPDRSHGGSRDETFGAVVGDSLQFEDYENEQVYNAKQSTYIILKNDTSLLTANTPADEDFQNFYAEMQESNIGFFEEVNEQIAESDTSEADSVNIAIADTNWIEYNKKTVNDLYINKYLKGIPFTAADSMVLESIALQNSVTGGDAVFMARAILKLEVHEQPLAFRKAKDNVTKDIGDKIVLAPNPAKNKLIIFGLPEERGDIEIFDSYNRSIYKENNSSKNFEINLNNFANGIYYLRISNNSNNYFKTSFAVIK